MIICLLDVPFLVIQLAVDVGMYALFNNLTENQFILFRGINFFLKILKISVKLSFPQSDTAAVKVPELDLELTSGTMGGMVTTVEGLITKISESKLPRAFV